MRATTRPTSTSARTSTRMLAPSRARTTLTGMTRRWSRGRLAGRATPQVSGLAFYRGGAYPDAYDGALFFADYSRNCIWVMKKGTNGIPDPAKRSTFVAGAAAPVDLQIGPNGDLFYVDLTGGTLRHIRYSAANQPPIARATANPTNGPVPLAVSFDGTSSSDPEGGALSYEWDLDGDTPSRGLLHAQAEGSSASSSQLSRNKIRFLKWESSTQPPR